MFFCFLYKFGYFVANILPLRGAYWLAERLSDMHCFLSKKDREAVVQNLSIVLKKDARECRVMAQKVFRNFGLYMVDFFRMMRLDKDVIKERVRFEGLENIDSVLKKNKGAIILTCHIGNWEMGGVVMGILGYDIAAVVLTHIHKEINEFFIGQREKKGLKVISMGSVMKGCVSILLRKGILALASDRDFTNSGIQMDFFGVPTSMPKGPAALSLKTNSPIVPAFFLREDKYNYKFIFDKPIEIRDMPGFGHDEMVKEITKRSISVMEKYIRAYPDQWLVFRRFWETPSDAFVV